MKTLLILFLMAVVLIPLGAYLERRRRAKVARHMRQIGERMLHPGWDHRPRNNEEGRQWREQVSTTNSHE